MTRWLWAGLILCAVSPAESQSLTDADFNGKQDFGDLFLLADAWGESSDVHEFTQFHRNWHEPATWGAPKDSVDIEITDAGREIVLYADYLGNAHLVYAFRDEFNVLQMAYTSVHSSGQKVLGHRQLTFREPGSLPGSGPVLSDIVLAGPPDKRGPFYVLLPSPQNGISLIRFNVAGYRTTTEIMIPKVDMWVNDLDAVVDRDGDLHVATTESFFGDATQTIRYHKFDRNGERLLGPVTVGERVGQWGWSELFRARICLDGDNVLIVWEESDESSPAHMRRVNGSTGETEPTVTLFAPTTEARCFVNGDGDVAMAYMYFEIGTGRNIFFNMLNPDLSPKRDHKRLYRSIQQSDGAQIAPVGEDFYVAWNEHSDNLTRVARVRTDGSLKGGIAKLSGPDSGFPSPVRLDSDPLGYAHVVHGDSDTSIGKLSYVKLRIE